MMTLDHVGNQEAMVHTQLGQQPLARTTVTSLDDWNGARGHGHHLGPCPVSRSRKREQEAARSNRSASLVSVAVTSQW